MFDVGFWELVLIFGVGLMILGPERMPRVASQIGRWVGRARRTASSLRRQLEQEIAMSDYKPPPPPPKRKPTHITPVNSPDNGVEDAPEDAAAEGGESASGSDTEDGPGPGQSTGPGPAEAASGGSDDVAVEDDERREGGDQ